MKDPITGEHAHKLTPAMVEALRELAATHPLGHFVPNRAVRQALLNRKFVEYVAVHISDGRRDLLKLTPRGYTAALIAQRQRVA